VVDGAVELGGEVDAAIGVGAEVLNVAGKDLVVAEEADGADGAGDSADAEEVFGFEGAKDDEEDAGRRN